MSTPPSTPAQAGGAKNAPAARRVSVSPTKPRLDLRLPIAASVLSLLVGLGAGVGVMKHRRVATQVVASVNGQLITEGDFNHRLQGVAGQAVIHNMVAEDLQLQFAKSKGVVPTEAQVDTQLAIDKERPDFDRSLAARGMDLAAYRDALRVRLAQAMVYSQGVAVSDAEVRAYYAAATDPKNPAAPYYTPPSINLSVISVPSFQLGQKALKELNSGTPFALVASAYSTDESKAQGGAIAPLTLGRSPISSNPALEKSLFALPANGLYGPTQFKNLFWIFHCERKNPPTTLPFSAVSDQCRQGALFAKGAKVNGPRIAQEFAAYQKSVTIKAFWPQFEKAVTGK